MLSHTGTLWHYLGSFILYTLMAVGLIYGAYLYARKASVVKPFLGLGKKPESPSAPKLILESSLALEPRKTLYVVCAGNERFLIAASGESTQLLSKLEESSQTAGTSAMAATSVAAVTLPPVDRVDERPWYTEAPIITRPQKAGFGARFVQSVQWLVSSRSGK
jgi:hypothetical protein